MLLDLRSLYETLPGPLPPPAPVAAPDPWDAMRTLIPYPRRPKRPAALFGWEPQPGIQGALTIREDSRVPPDECWIVDQAGRIVGKIVDIGEEDPECPLPM